MLSMNPSSFDLLHHAVHEPLELRLVELAKRVGFFFSLVFEGGKAGRSTLETGSVAARTGGPALGVDHRGEEIEKGVAVAAVELVDRHDQSHYLPHLTRSLIQWRR
jgi:hypothetical protein